jgi:hypothetical protein
MTERKVVFDRILGVEHSKLRGDLLRRGPTRRAAARQAEVPTDAVNVRVDRDDEVRWRDWPKSEVHAIRPPNHPTRVQDQPFAGASPSRIADEVSGVAISRVSANRVREKRKTLPKVAVPSMKRCERRSKRTVVAKKRPSPEKHTREMWPAIDPVDEAVQPTAKRPFIGFANESGRLGAELLENELDAATRCNGVTKRKARRHEPDDLLIPWARIAMHEADWISTAGHRRIEVGE